MKIVVDTNVLVSGLLTPFNPPAMIVRMVVGNVFNICYDSRLLVEYDLVLKRPKFKFDKSKIGEVIEYIKDSGNYIAAEPLGEDLIDNSDKPFLEVAISGKIDYLITGNKKHFPEKKYKFKIVSPAEFIKEYKKFK